MKRATPGKLIRRVRGLVLSVLPALLLAGLAGSLHCVGMCGPILLAFSQVFRPPGEEGGGRLALQRDFLFYHAGRIWTYGMLGFLAGLLGKSLRQGAALAGWRCVQRYPTRCRTPCFPGWSAICVSHQDLCRK